MIISNWSRNCQWGSFPKTGRLLREKGTKTGAICCGIVIVIPDFAKNLCHLEFPARRRRGHPVFAAETARLNLDGCCGLGAAAAAPQTVLEIPVAKVRQTPERPICAQLPDVRQGHPVEGVVLAGGIDGHIAEVTRKIHAL